MIGAAYMKQSYKRRKRRPNFPRTRENMMNPDARYNKAFAPYNYHYRANKSNPNNFYLKRDPTKDPSLPF